MSKRLIIFPRMGNSWISFKTYIKNIGDIPIIPRPLNKRVLELGVKYSPEGICFPFKVLLGQYLDLFERLNLGKERKVYIISLGGYGPCRFGYYNALHEKILKDLGYKNFEIITVEGIDHPFYRGFPKFIKMIGKLFGFHPPWRIIKGFINAGYKLYFIDKLEKLAYKIMPREINRGETLNTLNKALTILDKAPYNNLRKIKEAYEEGVEMLKRITIDKKKEVIKVGLVGEAYMLMDYDNNREIEKKLAYLGVEVDRSLRTSTWASDRIIFVKKHKEHMMKIIKPYLNCFIGGDGQESVMNTILYKEKGYDGVVHVLPFGCLPEIVAKEILAKVSRDIDMPVLSISLDEQTGEAGLITRLEAFVDLLRERKYKQKEVLV
ncbi:MAG: CoA protein activase [Spirochaetes bacterium]|nr:MAG: CoA protein activase [Spirochaetota bacterium]